MCDSKVRQLATSFPVQWASSIHIWFSSFLWAMRHQYRIMHHHLLKLEMQQAERPQCDTSEMWNKQPELGIYMYIFAFYHAEWYSSVLGICVANGQQKHWTSLGFTGPRVMLMEPIKLGKCASATQRELCVKQDCSGHTWYLCNLPTCLLYSTGVTCDSISQVSPRFICLLFQSSVSFALFCM